MWFDETKGERTTQSRYAYWGVAKGGTGTRYKVVCSSLRVRKGAGTIYGTAKYLKSGDTVTVQRINGNWGEISPGLWICLKPAYVKEL